MFNPNQYEFNRPFILAFMDTPIYSLDHDDVGMYCMGGEL